MTAPSFILITSIIVRFGEGGLTEARPFTTLEVCFQNKISLDIQLKGKVASLDSRCEEMSPKPVFKPPQAVKGPGNTAAAAQDPSLPQPEVVAFTIKCNYARTGVQQQTANVATAVPTSHTAKN